MVNTFLTYNKIHQAGQGEPAIFSNKGEWDWLQKDQEPEGDNENE